MPATTLTANTAVGGYGVYTTANIADVVMTAADAANTNDVVLTNNQIIIAHNTGASARNLVVSSAFDPYNRRRNITYQLGAGEYCVLGPFRQLGWALTSGKLLFSADHAEVKFGVVNLPGG